MHVATITDVNNQSKLVESSILRNVKVLKKDETIVRELDEDIKNDHLYRVTLGTWDIENHKVSLLFYREESKKIFKIIRKYCDVVEKYGCDEAYLNVTKQVNKIFEEGNIDYENPDWLGSYMMSYPKTGTDEQKGLFVPSNDHEKRLYIAS